MLLVPGVAAASTGDQQKPAQPGKPVVLEVSGSVVVGFFPPVSQSQIESDDGGIREGIAHLQFTLEDVAKCLANKSVSVRMEFTRGFRLHNGKRQETIEIPSDEAHIVGAILVRPDAAARVVYATAGPSSLILLLPEAASEYFNAPVCRREPSGAHPHQDAVAARAGAG